MYLQISDKNLLSLILSSKKRQTQALSISLDKPVSLYCLNPSITILLLIHIAQNFQASPFILTEYFPAQLFIASSIYFSKKQK